MKLKQFQREDLARAALHDGLILGLDTGLGKTICAYVWSALKVGLVRGADGKPVRPMCPAEPVLLVASGDLHEQIINEGLQHFGVRPTVIDSQEKFLRLASINAQPAAANRYVLQPGYYLTTYTQLSRNGVAPFPELDRRDPSRMLRTLNLRQSDVEEFFSERAGRYEKFYARLEVTASDTLATLNDKWTRLRKSANSFRGAELDEAYDLLKDFAPARSIQPPLNIYLTDLTTEQQTAVTRRFVAVAHAAMATNVGEERYYPKTDRTIKCVYSASLADLGQDSFAVVAADEGTKLKGEDTLIGKGTRQMKPRYRLPLTATPIKNRLPDVFRLAHWATGSKHLAHPRFPFADQDRDAFSEEFMVSERNLSAEARSDSGRRFVKLTPQVCNIHRLWKFLCPIILRRRKEECGEELVAMQRHVVRVPMGTRQAAVYKFHMDAKYLDKNERPATGAKLQALRIAAANPASLLLTRPHSDSEIKGEPRSNHPYVPKLASALALIKDILDRRQQVIIFSAFHDSLDALSAHLDEAGIKHLVLDGRMTPTKRGAAAAQFKKGPAGGVPVLLAGVECMSEGHSFNLCSNVILMAYSWAFDKFLQAINRIWRLNSIADVNVYPIICTGSIDRTLEANIQEKRDAAELVLDGHLLGENPQEVNLAALLRIAEKEFAEISAAGTIDEAELENEWPALRAQLGKAFQSWKLLPVSAASKPIERSRTPATDQQPDLVLLGCGKKKLATTKAVAAELLYTGPLFTARRKFAVGDSRPWMILSAAHGVVAPNAPLLPYDVTVSDHTPEQRTAWKHGVRAQVLDYFGGREGSIGKAIELHAGNAYVEALQEALEGLGITVVQAMENKGIGTQLLTYKEGYQRPHPSGSMASRKPFYPKVPKHTPEPIAVGVTDDSLFADLPLWQQAA